jgi:hypothetical protein
MKKSSFKDYAETATEAPAKRVERRQFRPGKTDRPTLTIRLDKHQWERIRKAMIDENMTVQDYVSGLIARDFEARGWRWE